MTVLQGDFSSHFDAVDADVTIRGVLSAGVTVRTGVELLVQGAVLGDVCIEEGAILRLQGSFSETVLSNAGLLMIAGHTDRSALATGDGLVDLAVGSVITDDGNWVLHGDGSLTDIGRTTPTIRTDGTDYCRYLPEQNRFGSAREHQLILAERSLR
ncbi:hypothetical protein EXE59_15125 [Nocardioides eburneiflavus]|uniref:Polymer-forming cytoskeletal protein n=1 Tax=Nocardioides eburneiflavus TaxID=2518372 RepID=A0A4Z1C4C1_9ACTN|nr:hypothetical protein [Nocardioides eburneiflavus]TGN65144.1 hypothetical protein EXE59_15125 [Nocardioides eburneiflavus]